MLTASFTANSPYGHSTNKLIANVVGGWALNGIVQFSNGQPFTVVDNNDPENVGCCLQERVNVTGNPHVGLTQTIAGLSWFDPTAFSVPTGYAYGTEKVNQFTSQAHKNLDMSLFRQFHIGLGEDRYFEFRAEAFNLFNHVILAGPDSNIGDYHVNADGTPSAANRFGIITGQVAPYERQLQMALKFYY